MRPSASLLLLSLAACPALEPDPVIRDGIDLGPIQSFEAERIQGNGPHVGTINDGAASDSKALGIYSGVTVEERLDLLTEVSGFVVRAKGQECKGWPELIVTIDGVPRVRAEVKNVGWRDFPGVAHLKPGRHQIAFQFTNDLYEGASCDRNLFVDKLTFVNTLSANHGDLRAVSMLLPGGVEVIDDARMPGGKVVGFMQSAEASGETQLDAPMAGLAIRARGEDCKGPPEMDVTVDGVDRFTGTIGSSSWADIVIPLELSAGPHSVGITFPNDRFEGPGCDRNLFVEGVHFLASLPADAGPTPGSSAVGGGFDGG